MRKLDEMPTMVGAGAIYPYSFELMKQGFRQTPFGEQYNLFREMGVGKARRVWVPRNLAPDDAERDYAIGLPVKFNSTFKPRNSEQARVVAESVQLLAQGENFIAECPTGFGKTICSMDIIAQVGRKTLVVVTKEDIKDQWIEAAKNILGLTNKDIGIIQGDRFQVAGKKLVIAMIQSLAKEDRYPAHQMKEFGLVIFDEVHRVAAEYFSQACFRVPAKLRLGLSATPDRKDGREAVLLAHIGQVKVTTTAAPMTPRVIARVSPWKVPQTRIKTKNGYVIGPIPHTAGKCGHIINMLANHQGRNQMLVTFTVAAYKKGRTILVQSDRREHLETLAMMCQKCGISPSDIGYYVGGLTAAEREEVKHKKVIFATYQMTAEATDIPWLDTLVMGTPKSDVRQIVGRIIRIHEGKQEPIVFDLIDLSSGVFTGYWNRRREWYRSVDAEISMGE